MGQFLSLSGIPDSTPAAIEKELHEFLKRRGGALFAEPVVGDKNILTIAWTNSDRVVVEYPEGVDFEAVSAHLSRQLKTPVFGFHIHDSDFWMYAFCLAGQVKDRFSPVTEYYQGFDESELRGRPRTV